MASGNHRLTDFAAALGAAQLPRLDAELDARRAIADMLRPSLPALTFQAEAPGTRANLQTFGALVPEGASRDETLARLRAAGVEAGKLSYALGRIETVGPASSHPNAEAIADRGLALPMFGTMDAQGGERIVRALEDVR